MAHLSVTDPSDYTGTLTLGRHPDGELAFEDGVADVESEDLADALVDRYPNLSREGSDDATETEGDESEPADAPLDPSEHTVAELEDALDEGDYSDSELDAIEDAEREGDDARETAIEAIADARAE